MTLRDPSSAPPPPPPSQARQGWLDGIRGLAAFVVGWFHFTVDIMQTPYRSFWDLPAEQNRLLIQLAPFRILFCGNAMVRVFFVVSGYSVSIAIIRHRDRENNGFFYQKLSSSVLRRVIRLYTPVVVLCLASQILLYMGAYHWDWDAGPEGCYAAEPWAAIWPHLKCCVLSFLSSLSLTKPPFFTGGLNGQLWSMADEIKGSMAVYLLLLSLASVKPKARIFTISGICALLLWCAFPHTSAFVAGHLFAELDLLKQQQQMPNWMPTIMSSSKLPPVQEKAKRWVQPGTLMLFMLGIYFLCLPVLEDFPVDYWHPVPFDLVPLWVGPFVRINGWHAVGSIIVIWTLRHLPSVRTLLEAPLPRFLGKISFSFYLFHQPFIRTLRNPILHFVCMSLAGKDVYATRDDPACGFVYFFAWVVAGSIIAPLAIITSVYVTKVVDRHSVQLSYKAEKLLAGH